VITGDYWTRTLPAALETQRGRAPTALAFRAAQVVLGAHALFSDQLLQNLLNPPGKGGRAAAEMHHLFPKAWLQKHGVTDRRRINQVANLADVGWNENGAAGMQNPASYVPQLRGASQISDEWWGRMCAEHALPPGWESMEYDDFLTERRPRMAEIIRIAYRKLGGEMEAPPLTPPWFLPGAEAVWRQIAETELGLRGLVKEVYALQFGNNVRESIEASLGATEREQLSRASRNMPSASDPLNIVDYLYLGQLAPLLFKQGVWQEVRQRLGNDADLKGKLQTAINHIVPVRNEIAHVREIALEKLQRASLACADIRAMLGGKEFGRDARR
jgi:hypothetical protein